MVDRNELMKMIKILIAVISIFIIVGCSNNTNLDTLSYINDGSKVKYNDTYFTFWGAADSNLKNEKFGVITENGDKQSVYSVKNYKKTEWIIIAKQGSILLYKADNVSDIPNEFLKYNVDY
jgi:uncharacterized protein YcfL